MIVLFVNCALNCLTLLTLVEAAQSQTNSTTPVSTLPSIQSEIRSDPGTFIYENHGLMLTYGGKIGVYDSINIVSLFLDVTPPSESIELQRAIDNLATSCTRATSLRETKQALEKRASMIKSNLIQFVHQMENLYRDEKLKEVETTFRIFGKTPFLNNSSGSSKVRPKRFLGLEVVSLGLSAYNRYEQSKIQHHLKKVDREIQKLQNAEERQTKLDNQIVKFETNVISLLAKVSLLESSINHAIHCEQLRADTMLQLKTQLERWEDKLNKLLTYTSYGVLTGLLTPSVLSIDTLEEVVKHRTVKSTIFYERPELLYQHGQITLISMSPNLDQFHFTLTFPDLTKENITAVFETNQVGVRLPNATKCFSYLVEKYLIVKKGTFSPIDISKCSSQRSGLILCKTNLPRKIDQGKTCLAKDNITCPLAAIECSTKYITDPAGVLIFSSQNITVIYRESTEVATVVRAHPYTNTIFFPWTEVAMVMVEGSVIESPDVSYQVKLLISPFHMTNSFNETVFSPVSTNFNTTTLTTMVANQNASIELLKAEHGSDCELIPDFFKSKKNGHKWLYLVIVVVVLVVIGAFVGIGFLAMKVSQINKNHLTQEFSGAGGANLLAALTQLPITVPLPV